METLFAQRLSDHMFSSVFRRLPFFLHKIYLFIFELFYMKSNRIG